MADKGTGLCMVTTMHRHYDCMVLGDLVPEIYPSCDDARAVARYRTEMEARVSGFAETYVDDTGETEAVTFDPETGKWTAERIGGGDRELMEYGECLYVCRVGVSEAGLDK